MDEPAAKRHKPDEAAVADTKTDDLVPPPPPPGDPEPDPVTAALAKITSHIGSARKVPKAAGLLRQLLASGTLTAQHGPAVFAALRAAMAEPARADQPELCKEYTKVFTAASKAKHLFSASELAELDVYGLWAVLRQQLSTDDSFQFNRVVGVIKRHVVALPEASSDDDAIMAALQARLQDDGGTTPQRADAPAQQQAAQPDAARGNDSAAPQSGMTEQQADAATHSADAATGSGRGHQLAPQPGPAQQTSPAAAEADPFGLEQVLEQQQALDAKQAAAAAWSPEEATCMRRAALLDCFDSMQAACGKAWAQLSVEIAVEELAKQRARFGPAQQPRISALHQFAKDQRLRRQRGPSAADRRWDTTSFEAARKEWGGRTVSARGTIMTGDAKTAAWLG